MTPQDCLVLLTPLLRSYKCQNVSLSFGPGSPWSTKPSPARVLGPFLGRDDEGTSGLKPGLEPVVTLSSGFLDADVLLERVGLDSAGHTQQTRMSPVG